MIQLPDQFYANGYAEDSDVRALTADSADLYSFAEHPLAAAVCSFNVFWQISLPPFPLRMQLVLNASFDGAMAEAKRRL